MELTGRFNFSAAAVKSGTRSTGSANPTIQVPSTKDKFILNNKAMRALQVSVGDRVQLIDLMEQTDDMTQRFAIARGGKNARGIEVGAIIGKGGAFSYAGIWSAILMSSIGINVTEASNEDLVRNELVEARGNTVIGLTKAEFELDAVTQINEDGEEMTEFDVNGITTPIYMFTNPIWKEHTPKVFGVTDTDEE